MRNPEHILVTTSDFEALQRLIDANAGGRNAELADMLDSELSRAEVRDQVPAGVVTMHSTVVFEDETTRERREVKLCFPHEVHGPGDVSVLAPVGSALLGLSVGEEIEWPAPGGARRLRIIAVPHQGHRPEKA